MGILVNGEWQDRWYDTETTGGKFQRSVSAWRNWVTPDGSAGPSGEGGFEAESGRYHLYVSHACPWAHRTMIFRTLKGLENHISVSVVHPVMLSEGWTFADDFPGATGDTLFGLPYLRDIYLRADPNASGRVTVPILWDRKRETIVSNESAEIIRMFNSAFDTITGNQLDFYPPELRDAIDATNSQIYDAINNGVYKAGFATSPAAYNEGVTGVFSGLDTLEEQLTSRRYLMGSRLTEADWRLFTTLVRFDEVYHTHFKCNRRWLREYPNLWGWTRELYQMPGIAQTVSFDHINNHYYRSHPTINPYGIIPTNPIIDWSEPHGRDHLEKVT